MFLDCTMNLFVWYVCMLGVMGILLMQVEPSSANSTPMSAKKPMIDNMLALEQKSTFVSEKAAELFVDDQRASIVVNYTLLVQLGF